MASEWETVRLGDVADLLAGFPFSSERYTSDENGPRLLRGDNIVQGSLRWDGVKRWPHNATSALDAYWLRQGDVVVAMDRPWIDAGLKHASIRGNDLPALLVQRVARLRGTARLDTAFLKYVTASRAFTEHVLAVQTGTAVPHISGDQIRSFRFALPPLAQQRAIAHVLGTLDDKIDVNRRMSQTLEATTRALFQSWFVDFDPVRIRSEGRDCGLPSHLADLFPDSFEDSEAGEIPAGWGVGRLGNVVAQSREQENPLASPEVDFLHYSIPAFDDGQRPKREFGRDIKSVKWRVPPGAVLVSKLNPAIERVWMTDVNPHERAVGSTEFLVLAPRPPFGSGLVYCLARSPLFRRNIEGLATGTSGSHQRAQAGAILDLPVTMPPPALVTAFERFASSLLMRALLCRRQSDVLAALRDALLPRLLSGELRIPSSVSLAESVT